MNNVLENSVQNIHAESVYYNIALKALEVAKNAKDSFIIRENVIIAITFSALCLEAFINQAFYSCPETINIDPSHINITDKWLLLPLLINAQETFKINVTPYQTFKELISVRNERFIHFKPHKEKIEKKNGVVVKDAYKGNNFLKLTSNINKTEKYFKCVAEMIKELNRLTNGKVKIPLFLVGSYYISSEPCRAMGGVIESVVPTN